MFHFTVYIDNAVFPQTRKYYQQLPPISHSLSVRAAGAR